MEEVKILKIEFALLVHFINDLREKQGSIMLLKLISMLFNVLISSKS